MRDSNRTGHLPNLSGLANIGKSASGYRLTPTSKAAVWPRGQVWKIPDGSWFVESSTRPGVYWRVVWHYSERDGSTFRCTCEAGRTRGAMGTKADQEKPCQHVGRVATAERADGFEKRPEATIVAANFVD